MEFDVPSLMQNKLQFNFGGQKVNQKLVHLINKVVCYNQGRYIQFEYLLGLRHMKVKREVQSETPDPAKVKTYMEELFRFANETIKEISKINFQYLINYLSEQREFSTKPRACIKTIGKGDKIVDFYRSEDRFYVSPGHDISSNTGFDYVANNGIYYLSNDIPGAAKQDAYINLRLNPQRARSYNPPKKKGIIRRKFPEVDRNWCNCWDYQSEREPAGWHQMCYKSTLIVPMTLRGCELLDEFKRYFFADYDSRMIWGFLCIDHHSANYFDTEGEVDAKLGYVIADLLSLYFISAHIHMELSSSFRDGIQILTENNLLPTTEAENETT